jgi:hypothetical protein
MNIKLFLTKYCLEEANNSTDVANIKKHIFLWWKNPRQEKNRSFALTQQGFDVLYNQIKLKFYQINFPKDIYITNQLLIWLDQFIDCPYYFTNKSIYVTKEKTAVQLILFGGDLNKFGKAKELSKKTS